MTPVQLPEVPAIARFNVTGDYCYPTVDDPEGSCVSYDDHAAQLREYATDAVMADRRAFNPQELAEKLHGWMADLMPNGDLLHPAIVCDYAGVQNFKRAMAKQIADFITPSETNSD